MANIDPATLNRAQNGDRVAVEQVLASIAAGAKTARKRSPRWLWIAAVAAICIAMFAIVVASDPGVGGGLAPREVAGGGFASGLAIGVVAGVAIGWVVARFRYG
jgi:hypothetical protein